MNRFGIYVWDKTSYKPYIGDIKYNRLYVGNNIIFQSITREEEEEEDITRVEVILNNEWQPMTENIPFPENVLGDAYESFKNYHVDSGVAKMRIIFENVPQFKIWYRSDGESSYDYLVVSKIDTELPTLPNNSSSQVQYTTYGKQNVWYEAVYENDGLEHFIEIAYRKDGSVNNEPDKGFVLIPRVRKVLNTRWTLTDGFICDGDNKYEKLVKEIQYDNPVEWVATKEYQKGNLIEENSADCSWTQLTMDTPLGTPITAFKFDPTKTTTTTSYMWIHLGETPTSQPNDNTWAISGYAGGVWCMGRMVLDGRETCIENVGTLEPDGTYTYDFGRTLYLVGIQKSASVEAIQIKG